MYSSDCADVAGLILAGGRGRRFGGKDKGLELWRGRTLTEHVIERLAPQVANLAISCNRNRETYARLNASAVVGDRRAGFQGPLAGIEAYATQVDAEFLAIAPCDMPLLPYDLVPRLRRTLLAAEASTAAACAFDGQREQYLCAIIRKPALNTLAAYLDSGERSVHGWLARLGVERVDFSDRAANFKNINFEAKDPGAA